MSRIILHSLFLAFFLAACAVSSPATVVVSIPPSDSTAVQPGDLATLAGTSDSPTAIARLPDNSTALPSDTATPPPPGQIGPLDFPPDVNPLTGETVPDPSVLDRRPLAIKISNYPACVRPQSGLSLADLVFEHYAEGGTTRFTAIFYSHNAPKVGSIRSARLIDLELPAMYRALFAFSGASDGVLKKLKEADFKDWIISPEFEPGHPAFYRVPKESLSGDCQLQEHTLFTSTDLLWADAAEKGINTRQSLPGMAFNTAPPASGSPATTISLSYSAAYVRWIYNAEVGRYFRYADGFTHTDASTGAPITAANVVVVFAHHQTTDIIEDFVGYDPRTKKGGNYSLEIQLWGVGPALVYRDGMVYSVTWIRQERFSELGLVDAATGQLLPLKPGNTWFELVNLESPITQPDANTWNIAPSRPTPPSP